MIVWSIFAKIKGRIVYSFTLPQDEGDANDTNLGSKELMSSQWYRLGEQRSVAHCTMHKVYALDCNEIYELKFTHMSRISKMENKSSVGTRKFSHSVSLKTRWLTQKKVCH